MSHVHMGMFDQLRRTTEDLKNHVELYRLALKDPRTPSLAKILLGTAIIYTALPFDLIPDFIPVIGHMDDAIIIPGLVKIALKLIPEDVMEECRMSLEKGISKKSHSRLKKLSPRRRGLRKRR